MAILKSRYGLEVSVLSDGTPLKEFDDPGPTSAPKRVTKYLETKSGATFSIKYSLSNPPATAVVATVTIDGHHIDLVNVEPLQEESSTVQAVVYEIQGTPLFQANMRYIQNFKFSPLPIIEGQNAISEQAQEELKGLGKIVLRFYRCKRIKQVDAPIVKQPRLKQWDAVPEEAMKGSCITQQTILSLPDDVCGEADMQVDECDIDLRKPFATVTYKYRSTAALRCLGILPRDPIPESTEEDATRPDEGMTEEQVREAYRRMVEETSRAVKCERDEERRRERSVTIGREDEDVEFVGQQAKRRCLPTERDEVVVLDD